jgi:hypothetical protein
MSTIIWDTARWNIWRNKVAMQTKMEKFMAKNVFHFKKKKLNAERTKQHRKQESMTIRMKEGPCYFNKWNPS